MLAYVRHESHARLVSWRVLAAAVFLALVLPTTLALTLRPAPAPEGGAGDVLSPSIDLGL